MSLRHLLITNHCVAEARDEPGKYKVVKRGWLPKFGMGPSFRSSISASPSSQSSDLDLPPDQESRAEKGESSGSSEEENEAGGESNGEEAVHQTELDLRWQDDRFSHLQAIRNDLSDMDLELIPGKPARKPFRDRVPAAATALASRVQNTLAWEGVATRLLAVSKFLF